MSGTHTNIGVVRCAPTALSKFTNNEIIVVPTNAVSCTAAISPALQLGTPVDFTIEVFTDEAATVSAGTFVAATNTFIPNANVLQDGTITLYVKFNDGANGLAMSSPGY